MRRASDLLPRAALLAAVVLWSSLPVARAHAASRAVGGAVVMETPPQRAERSQRLAAEDAADSVQQVIAAGVNRVMDRTPPTTFNIRNEIRAVTNMIRARASEARIAQGARLDAVLDTLATEGATPLQIARARERFEVSDPGNILGLSAQGVSDVSSLQRFGRRVPSVRGTLVGRYELLVSKPEEGRGRVKIGEVMLGDSQLISGRVSSAAAAEFFLSPLAGPTPALDRLPRRVPIKAVRWLYRGGAFVVSTKDARTDRFVGVEQGAFSITGVDLLPVLTRVELERFLAGSPDITTNADGAEGFFRGVTYTFRRIVVPPVVPVP